MTDQEYAYSKQHLAQLYRYCLMSGLTHWASEQEQKHPYKLGLGHNLAPVTGSPVPGEGGEEKAARVSRRSNLSQQLSEQHFRAAPLAGAWHLGRWLRTLISLNWLFTTDKYTYCNITWQCSVSFSETRKKAWKKSEHCAAVWGCTTEHAAVG